MILKYAKLIAVFVAAGLFGSCLGSAPGQAQDMQRDRLSTMLDRFAAELSAVLAEPASRAFVVERIEASKTKIVAIGDLLSAALAQGREGASLVQLAAQVRRIETALARAGAPVPRLDLKLPVRDHRDLLGSSETIYVLAAPLADESEVEVLTAYANREPVMLDPKQPPSIPTLVVIPGESESLEPTYPLPVSAEPGDEENPRKVDDFVGVPRIWIADAHEGWSSGDPEIYLVTYRSQGGSGFFTETDFPGVNDIQVWYNTGDPNASYLFYDSSFNGSVSLAIYERDNFAHGADDFLGSVTITWTALSFSGYTSFGNGDMQIRVDRD